MNLDEKRHWKYRLAKARGVWQMVRSLTKLPPGKKKKIVVSQILLILMYGGSSTRTPHREQWQWWQN